MHLCSVDQGIGYFDLVVRINRKIQGLGFNLDALKVCNLQEMIFWDSMIRRAAAPPLLHIRTFYIPLTKNCAH